MATYKKGIQTKERIFQSAKKMFYEYGYKNATIAKIAADAKVPIGLVNYYFKKNEILSIVYTQFLQNIKKAIDEQIGNDLENPLQRHIVFTRIFYSIMLSNDKNRELYKEIFINELVEADASDLVGLDFMEIVRTFDIDITESIFHRLTIAEYGARRELLLDRYDRLDPEKSKDFIDFLATISVRLAGVEIKEVMRNCKKADELYKKVDTSVIKFLI
ncbi:MAG: TetR/AcrR family transcriptional regulator [Eubacteriaceae bacterium]|nr:TetR/AcrR family transcriptional regulator [Eubacteriaceae bacterium]MBR5995729.1 TetR/AcrR family transcriptional regulator [Eubacteriaceae bacterium]